MGFSKDFLWGTATSSYQIEGAANDGKRGLTIWDDYCQIEGKIFGGHTGETACDHYHRYKEDVDLMASMGIRSYRFSIAWSRILPRGTGMVNEEGIEFYSSLVDELLQKNITPVATLYHWDMPYELYKRGGWLNTDSPKWFADYARIVAERLGDRVRHIITFNEPQCFIGLGYALGSGHAPGHKESKRSSFQMVHNVLLAHGKAVQQIRDCGKGILVGYAPTSTVPCPVTESSEDVEAARKAYFDYQDKDDYLWTTAVWSDPVLLGRYPEEGKDKYRMYLPKITDEDMKIISAPIDFYGQNIYHGYPVKSDGRGGYICLERKTGYPRTSVGWPIEPESLYWGPKFLYERYKKPIYITENGMAAHDAVSLDGKVHDPNRIDYMHRYLRELKRAAEEGIGIGGYFAWSLMDNFEWSKGYFERFGMVYVDYETQERIKKDSAIWYQRMIETNGENL